MESCPTLRVTEQHETWDDLCFSEKHPEGTLPLFALLDRITGCAWGKVKEEDRREKFLERTGPFFLLQAQGQGEGLQTLDWP